MPYKDPDKQREYKKHWERTRKAGGTGSVAGSVPIPFRLRTAQDILALTARHAEAVEQDKESGTLEKARTVGYLAGVALKAVELTDLGARLAKLEAMVKKRMQGEISLPRTEDPEQSDTTGGEEVI